MDLVRNLRMAVGFVAAVITTMLGLVLRLSALIIGAAFLMGVAVFAIALMTYHSYASHFVPMEELAVNRPSAGAKIFDRNGALLYQYVDDRDGIRKPVKLDDISPDFLAATIATEDSNFFENPGVNPRGLARAAWENFGPLLENGKGDTLQGTGGSSITQQLVKNVYIPYEERQERSLERKLREIVYSTEMTKRYDKSQILEWYVNQISYGGIYTGVEAASEGYFNKPAKDLTLAEATLLAGIPQSPAAYDPIGNLDAARARRNEVIDLMEKRELIQIGDGLFYSPNHEALDEARGVDIEVHLQSFPIEAPHFVLTYLVPQLEQIFGREALLHDGLEVSTTLDLDLQKRANVILEKYVSTYERASNSHNGATIVFKPNTGEILAMVGSRDYWRDDVNGQVNNLLALNSPGSSFKPFVYLTAMMKLGWTPGTIIEDTPVSYREIDGSVFTPQNPTKGSYAGPISLRNALGNSLNIPAFKTALQLGTPAIVDQAKSMGLTGFGGYYGPSIAIGGVDIRGLDLAYGYTSLANGGVIAGQQRFAAAKPDESEIQPVSILKVTDSRGITRYDAADYSATLRVAPAAQAYMISDVLSDPSALCVTFGCNGLPVGPYKVAIKTGTSQPYDPTRFPDKFGETWAFGYTPDYVVGVWAGNSDNTPVSNLFSTTIAYPTMRDIMLSAYNGAPETPFARPDNVVVKNSCAPVAIVPSGVQAPGSRAQPALPTRQVCTTDLGVR